jgi:RNA polymerase sigma-70 factor (ECF subfamily)
VGDFPETHESLLVQVRSAENREAWEQFVRLYRPVVYRLARRRGMQDADAQDLVQQVFISVAAAIGDWEKSNESVRFHHWLARVVRNAILNGLSRRPHDRAAGGPSVQELLTAQPDIDPETSQEIELEYRREIYLRGAAIVRRDVDPDTWRAFELTVIENCPIDVAAMELGKQVGAVYAARSRVMRRLREAVRELEKGES